VRDSGAVIHLESAVNVVIVHARARDLGEPSLTSEATAVLDAKYDQPGDGDYLPCIRTKLRIDRKFD
jgi:hypothetical protein